MFIFERISLGNGWYGYTCIHISDMKKIRGVKDRGNIEKVKRCKKKDGPDRLDKDMVKSGGYKRRKAR